MDLLAGRPWLLVAVAYLVAAIPMGLIVARARGVDLRAVGSGNIGATNAVRALGPRWGGLVFALDVAKAYGPVQLAATVLAGRPAADTWLAAAAFAAVAGHVFPIYLGFRGGKGVACALGVVAALDPILAAAGLALYVQTLVLSRTSALGSLTAVTAMTFTAWIAPYPEPMRLAVTAVAALIWLRHRDNLRAMTRARGAGASRCLLYTSDAADDAVIPA